MQNDILLDAAVAITTTIRLHYDILYDDKSHCKTTTYVIYSIIMGVTEGNMVVGINKMNMICDLSKINALMKQQDEYRKCHYQLLFLARIIKPTTMIELKYNFLCQFQCLHCVCYHVIYPQRSYICHLIYTILLFLISNYIVLKKRKK